MVAVAAVWVVVDQFTKHWALSALADGRMIDLVWTLRFNLAFNTGTAFGLGSGFGPVVAILAVIVAAVLVRVAGTMPTRTTAVALGMLLGGAVGNLVDRVFRAGDGFLGGAVVDFIDLQWWPIFNVADIGIVGGGLLLVIAGWSAAGEPLPDEDDEPAEPDDPAGTEPDAPDDPAGAEDDAVTDPAGTEPDAPAGAEDDAVTDGRHDEGDTR